MRSIIQDTIKLFCLEFIKNPYLCYTEHGQHALFFERLYRSIPSNQRYDYWDSKKYCVIQKEFPTAGKLGKPTRQHWDIAVIKSPPESIQAKNSYDYLKCEAVIEFGMNEAYDHLKDDVDRICHTKSNIEHGFVVHFHRLSIPGQHVSGRDWSPKSRRIIQRDQLFTLVRGKPIEIYYGMSDLSGTHENGVWVINQDGNKRV